MPAMLPDQRVSENAKRKPEFYKNTYDYLIALGINLNNRIETKNNLDASNGIISPKKFKEVISPFTATVEEVLPKLPGEIRDVDFITPIKEKNLGEYIELPYKFYVKSENPDTVIKFDGIVREEIYKLLVSEFQRLLEQAQAQTEQGGQPQQPDLVKYYKDRLDELFNDKALEATHILNLINNETNFDTMRIQAFYYWWATEEFYTYREVINGQIVKHVINPIAAYPISNGKQFVEDYDAFVWKNTITYEQLLERDSLYKELGDEDLAFLKTFYRKDGFIYYGDPELIYSRFLAFNSNYNSGTKNDVVFATSDANIIEWNVIWKSQEEAKELYYIDEYGNEIRKIVPVDYKLNPEIGDIKLETIWIPKVYMGRRYGDENTGIYTIPKPVLVQRYDEETNEVKLPVGGKKGLLEGFALNPIPKRLIPFTVVDKILLLMIEREIAKYLPFIKVIPQSVINNDASGTSKQKMALLKADNTLIYDDTKVDINTVIQGLRVIATPSIAEYINTLWEIRMRNKADAWEISNMNSERFGATSNSQTVTNASQNIYRAKLGSTLMITMFNKALELDHKADLDFSKYAYINGKKGTFFDKSSGDFVDVNIDPIEHINNKYFPIVVNSKVEEDKLQQFKELAFSAAQNGDLDVAAEAISADSVPAIRQTIRDIVETKRKFDESIATRKEELTVQAAKIADETAEKQILADKAIQDSINQTEIETKYIDADIAKYKVDNSEKENEPNTKIDEENSIINKSKLRLAEREQNRKDAEFAHKQNMDNKNYELKKKQASQRNITKKK